MGAWDVFQAIGEKFLERSLIPMPRWKGLEGYAKASAFGMVRAWDEQLLSALRDSLVDAQREGWTPKEWSARADEIGKRFGATLGLSGPDGTASYADLVFRMGWQNATADGRFAAQFSPDGQDFAGYWRFLAVRDGRNDEEDECPNIICRGLHGKVFRKDDADALVFWPPVHFNCRCFTQEVPARLLERRGWDVTTGADAIAAVGRPPEGFGVARSLEF